MFDFENDKYEAYIEDIKYKNGIKEISYRLIKGDLRKRDESHYILETTAHEPITILLNSSEDLIWGENKEYGKHWYKPCNFETIPEIIKNAKNSS